MIPTQQQISVAIESADQKTKDFLDSDILDDVFYDLRDQFKLHLDSAEKLALSIVATVVGISDISNFSNLLKEAVPDMPKQDTDEMLKIINEKIFLFLRKKEEEKVSKIDITENSLEEPAANEQPLPVASPEKLDTETNGGAEEVEIKMGEPEEKSTYKTSPDPYREPID